MRNSRRLIIIAAILVLSSLVVLADPPIPFNYPMSTPHYQLQNEEQIFVCPTDSLIVMADWRDFRLGYRQVAIGRSTDGGNTWNDSLIRTNFQVEERQSDPTMAVDNDGNFYISVLDYDPNFDDDSSYITFIKSTDKGVSWTGPYPVVPLPGPYFEDKQFIAVDRTGGPYEGNIYVAWARFPNPNRIMFARSVDGAISFEDTLIVGPNVDFSYCGGPAEWDAGQFAFPFVGSNGDVYVSWVGTYLDSSDCTYHSELMLATSTDGGQSFTPRRHIKETWGNWGVVDGNVDVYNMPICAVDISGGPFDGDLYISYANVDTSNPAYYDYNIEFIKSTDNGASWTEPIYINDDYKGPGAMYDQFHPWMICNEEGTLITIWYDQRTDPVNHFLFDVFAAYSFDGGESWTTNHRISSVSVDPNELKKGTYEPKEVPYAPDYSSPPPAVPVRSSRAGKIAEYIGVTAFKDHINATWTDTRNGNQDVFGANWVLPLLKPRLIYPADQQYLFEVDAFNWATTWKHDDDRYQIEVATDDQFVDLVISETVTESSYSPATALGDGTYYWRVQAFKISDGTPSELSDVHEFTIDSYVPPVPALIYPGDGSVVYNDSLPTYTWSLGEVPTSIVYYQLEVSTDPTFTDNGVKRTYAWLTDTTYEAPDPVRVDSIYYWRVKAENQFGIDAGFSTAGQFTFERFLCGDLNDDGDVNILDIVNLINYKYKEGPEPDPLISADVNSDGNVDILDIVRLINYKYKEGPEPDCPD
jgi:hypothetical protein